MTKEQYEMEKQALEVAMQVELDNAVQTARQTAYCYSSIYREYEIKFNALFERYLRSKIR